MPPLIPTRRPRQLTLRERSVRRLAWGVLAACALLAAGSGAQLLRTGRDNARLAAGSGWAEGEREAEVALAASAAAMAAGTAPSAPASAAPVAEAAPVPTLGEAYRDESGRPASAAAEAASATASAASAAAPSAAERLAAEQARLSPLLRFARAFDLARQADRPGEVELGLARYRTLYADPVWGLAARYNSANALMRQAQQLRAAGDDGQAVALVELAKLGYREVLRAEPQHWDARYNLERALRLQPDLDEEAPAIGGPRNESERAANAMRGVSKGLP